MSVTKLSQGQEQQDIVASTAIEGDQGGAVSTPLESLESEIDNFPPLVRDYVRLLMFETNSPMISALVNTLSVISSVVQKRLYIPEQEVARNIKGYFQTLYPNLWIMVVNRSGRHKTTTLMKAHKISFEIEEILGCDKNDQKAVVSKFLIDKVVSDELESDEFSKPLSIMVPERITIQALIKRLSEDKGGLILSSEFGSVLKALAGADGSNTTRSTLTDFFDCRKGYKYETKTSGTYVIDEPFLSIFGALTYSSFGKLVTEDDVLSGFLPRFLLFAPGETDEIPPALPRFEENIPYKDARENLKKHLLGLRKKIKYEISPEGKKAFIEMHNNMYEFVESKDQDFSDCLNPFLRRWSPYVLKIAMLIEYCKNSESSVISKNSLLLAFRVVEVAYVSTLKLLSEYIVSNETIKSVEKVLNLLKRNNGMVTRKKLLESKIKNNHKEYDFLIEYMVQTEKIKVNFQNNKPNFYEIV